MVVGRNGGRRKIKEGKGEGNYEIVERMDRVL